MAAQVESPEKYSQLTLYFSVSMIQRGVTFHTPPGGVLSGTTCTSARKGKGCVHSEVC
jgi:hypothetical protein